MRCGKDSRILLIQRSAEEEHAGGLYSLPGGKMEFSPDSLHVLEDNVRREIKEEIGITLGGELTYVHSSTFLIGDTQVLNLVFLATDFTGEPWIRSPEEVSGIVWIDPGEQEGPDPSMDSRQYQESGGMSYENLFLTKNSNVLR
ncbi:NUDIX hydrolase [Halobacillus litoralis]|nr:NUDIX hydrolase [Halobacillus litoralis]